VQPARSRSDPLTSPPAHSMLIPEFRIAVHWSAWRNTNPGPVPSGVWRPGGIREVGWSIRGRKASP